MAELWKPVVGYEGRYEVSNRGGVRSVGRMIQGRPGVGEYWKRGRDLRPSLNSSGYWQVKLYKGPRQWRSIAVHILVLDAFVGPRPDRTWHACHNDGNRQNCDLSNLRWDTQAANVADKVKHGNHALANRTHCNEGHPFDSENTRRRKDGSRACRACQRERVRRDRAAKRAESDLLAMPGMGGGA